MSNFKIIVAGPGAGKTHSLTDIVINNLQYLKKNRYCAVITYTNAATEELRKRISAKVPLPPNVFIGTIHSFLIRFIIEPYGHLTGITTKDKNYVERPTMVLHENYGRITLEALKKIPGISPKDAKEIVNMLRDKGLCNDKNTILKAFRLCDDNFKIHLPSRYADLESNILDAIKSNCVYSQSKRANHIERCLPSIASKFSSNGVISYDNVVEMSLEILNKPSILKAVSYRLQFMFLDEYQDNRLMVHDIIANLQECQNSNITIIGDPLQAIYKFAYSKSLSKKETGSQPQSFEETPMMLYNAKFCENRDERYLENRRSSVNIVKLINRYGLSQCSINGDNEIPIYFIGLTRPSQIYEEYRNLMSNHKIDNRHRMNLSSASKPFFKEMILTRKWIHKEDRCKKSHEIYNTVNKDFSRFEKGNYRLTSDLQEVSRCILGVTGKHKKDFIQSSYDELEFRKFCLTIARYIKSHSLTDKERCVDFIQTEFQNKYGSINDKLRQASVDDILDDLMSVENSNHLTSIESVYSTIHSSKGLEATSVLAIAYKKNELEKWFDFEAANRELDDVYRLGYVAFSRARDLLCIACLDKISDKLRDKFKSLDIVIVQEEHDEKTEQMTLGL